MIKKTDYNLLKLFSPLDMATAFYVIISGIYFCFSTLNFSSLLPHFVIRVLVLLLIVCFTFLSTKFSSNKLLPFLRSIYPIFFLGFFYTETSSMKNIIFATDFDAFFFNAEQYLWHCQPSIEFSKVINQGWFNEVMNMSYFSYYILIALVCFVMYFKKPKQSQKEIFIVFFSFYLYYIIFDILPVSGPQYFILDSNPEPMPPYFFGKLMHSIITEMEQPTGAFPSSHVGIAVIIALISFQYFKKLFFVILPFVIGICFATVYIKAHYLVDVIAGIISAPVFIILSGKVYNKFLSCCENDKIKTNSV